MSPQVIHETLVKQFSFVANDVVHTGMTDGKELYRLHSSFKFHRRMNAYVQGWKLADKAVQTVITVSDQDLYYRVWVSLRA